MNNDIIKKLKELGVLSSMDLHFAGLMEDISGKDPLLSLAAAFVSSQTRSGNVCLNLEAVSGKPICAEDKTTFPEKEKWAEFLESSLVVGKPGEYKPLVLENKKRLYMYRYWDYQKILTDFIIKRSEALANFEILSSETFKQSLARLFENNSNTETDWQKIAAIVSLVKDFSVISGGPGTGKTTTIVKILVLLVELHLANKTGKGLRIALAAPTGKAAMRLSESIASAWGKIHCSDKVRELVPDKASTIHRLLGVINGTPYFRYNEKRKLPVDVVIVDEASMVDLALMGKLIKAIPDHGKLILLGDQDQLASVEAGAVLGDICNTGQAIGYSPEFLKKVQDISSLIIDDIKENSIKSRVSDSIVVLKKSYRFGDKSGIGSVSRAANRGDTDFFAKCFSADAYGDVKFYDLPDSVELERVIRDKLISGYSSFLTENDPVKRFDKLDGFRIICGVRRGPYGVEGINLLAERVLAQAGLINPKDTWYPGRPIIITQNDYSLGLFNGDVGITTSDSNKDTKVCFMDREGGIRAFTPQNLPEHETVYAMTVHKSQGSEFDKLIFILPDYQAPVLTRELIYTGITRARKYVDIIGSEAILKYAVSRRTTRITGLRDALWS